MRKITEQASAAFIAEIKFSGSNTVVAIDNGFTSMYLFGNKIAKKNNETGETLVTNANWNTPTTRERLNGIPGVHASQVKGEAILNGNNWDGKWTVIKSA